MNKEFSMFSIFEGVEGHEVSNVMSVKITLSDGHLPHLALAFLPCLGLHGFQD